MKIAVFVPGRLQTRTGGYEYDRRMIAGLRDRGWPVDVRELDGSFPHPTAAARDDAARQLAMIPDGATVLVDGLALGSLPDEIEREASRLKVVALVHLPLAAEIGLDRETAVRLEAGERRALAVAVRIVVTGRSTIALLSKYEIAPDSIVLVEPATDRAPLAHGSSGGPLHLLSVAAITAGKGHYILIRALEATPNRDWLLTCAGSLDRDPSTVERLRARLRTSGLDDRVSLVGELDAGALERCYNSADIFVLATLRETYCMVVAEALAHGLPIISTTTGAIPQLVGAGRNGDNPAGLLSPPGDVAAMTAALTTVLGDSRVRERLAEGARRVRAQLTTWDDAVDKMAATLNDVG